MIFDPEVLAELIFNRFVDLLQAPLIYKEMLWIAIPMLVTLFLMELYFARYYFEELGWNSAFGNSLVLLFVFIDLMKYLYTTFGIVAFNVTNLKFLLAVAIALEGALLTLVSFLHLVPKDIVYKLSSKFPLNFIAYMAIVLVYSDLPLDYVTLIASLLILVLLSAIVKVLQFIIPKSLELAEISPEALERAPRQKAKL